MHRNYLIVNSEGRYWDGITGFEEDPDIAEIYTSEASAIRHLRESFSDDEARTLSIEPADWHNVAVCE